MSLVSAYPVARARLESRRLFASGVWGVLDRFVQGLENAHATRQQVRLLLRAVRGALQPDAVFLCSTLGGKAVEQNTDRPLAATWCRRFLRQHLDARLDARDDCLLAGAEVPRDGFSRPHSTVMVRLSKSRSLWLVAVNFGPGKLDAEALKVLLLIRRIFLDHRQKVQAHDRLAESVWGTVHGMNEAIAAKSPFTRGHSERVARMAVRLGSQMGLSTSVQSDLYLAGLLHDIGKIGIRDNVLQKPTALTDEEKEHMSQHPRIGERIVSKMKVFAHLRPGVRNHHERFDGTGYPDRLAGEAIPLVARVLSVVDACDAMMSPRPYRPGLPVEEIDAIMRAGAGKQWDPAIVEHFMACCQDLYAIHERGIGESVLQAVQEVIRVSQ